MFKAFTKICFKRNQLLTKRGISTSQSNCNLIKFNSQDEFVKRVFVENNGPAVVTFHADWFEPCNRVTSSLEIFLKHHEKVNLAVVKVEDYVDLFETFNVQAVPTVLGIKNRLVVQRMSGIIDNETIDDFICQLIAPEKEKQVGP